MVTHRKVFEYDWGRIIKPSYNLNLLRAVLIKAEFLTHSHLHKPYLYAFPETLWAQFLFTKEKALTEF